MTIKVILSCPLGSDCEKVDKESGDIHRCRWYKMVRGTDSQGKEHDEWDCSISWQPHLQLEVAHTTRGLTKAIESLRNENTLKQEQALRLMADAKNSSN